MVDPTQFDNVPLTGTTLQAALKMRCDLTGAAYAVYWANVGGKFQVAYEYTTAERSAEMSKLGVTQSYGQAAEVFNKNSPADSAVAKVKRTGEKIFVPKAMQSDAVKKDLMIRYGISSVAFEPYEAGVIEYGTTISASKESWTEQPMAPNMPKAEMRRAFEELGALYCVFWKLTEDGQIAVKADFESPGSAQLRQRMRSDGQSFLARSKSYSFSTDSTGPVATAMRERSEIVIVTNPEDDLIQTTMDGVTSTSRFAECKGLLARAADIQEFGIRSLHLVPVDGGVFEYGVAGEATLSDVTLESTIELECEAAGASYAIYWKESRDGMSTVASGFVTPEFRAEIKGLGFTLDYAQASEAFSAKLDASNDSPVAVALRTRKPIFIKDVAAYEGTFRRRDVAMAYSVKSVVFQPVLGGVIEMGKSKAAPTFGSIRKWDTLEDALANRIPNAALEAAFSRKGATYAIFWRRNFQTGAYEIAANYETVGNALNKQSLENEDSYSKASEAFTIPLMGDGPISTAGRSGVELDIPDLENYPNFQRKDLAKQWGVGKLTLVPCETGVLEYGTVTKDKRYTTVGSEFQEVQRQYRRSVFTGPDWVAHRSTDRFQKSLQTLLASGIVRARYNEIVATALIAAFVVTYNQLSTGFMDFGGHKMDGLLPFLGELKLPLSLFTLTGSSLGLLLVFRTNACYARWDDARKVWGSIINKCRSVTRQANTFFDDEYPGHGNFRDGRRRVAAETSAFTRCLRCFLRGEVDAPKLQRELKDLGFSPEEVAGYMSAGNRQVYALAAIGNTIRNADIDTIQRARMDETISQLCDDVGACERIFKTPIPTVYTGHTSRFTGTWLATLPFALYTIDTSWNHLVTIPAAALITFFLLGIEELGLQIEEPFSILPIESYCDASIGAPLLAMVVKEDASRKRNAALKAAAEAPVAVAEPVAASATAAKPLPEETVGVVQPVAAIVEEEEALVPFSDEWMAKFRRTGAGYTPAQGGTND